MTKNNNSNTSVFANMKNWFSGNDNQEETKNYKNKVNFTAKKLINKFPRVQNRFNIMMAGGLESVSSIEDTFNVPKQLEVVIQQNLLSFVHTDTQKNNTSTSLKDSLTIKEIYYFSDRAEHDLMRNMPSSKKWFGLATMIYFAGWWLKKYWYTNLFLKKIRNINLKFRQAEKSEVSHRLSMHASETFNNVVNINKNNNTNTDVAYDPFIHDFFVSLLVQKVWMRQDTNKLLSKKDIQEVKEHMLKNKDLFSSFNFSSKERKKDFSRFIKTNPYASVKSTDKHATQTQLGNMQKNFTAEAKGIRKEIEEEIKKAFPGAKVTVTDNVVTDKETEDLAKAWADKHKNSKRFEIADSTYKKPYEPQQDNTYPKVEGVERMRFNSVRQEYFNSLKNILKEEYPIQTDYEKALEQALKIARLDSNGQYLKPDTSFQDRIDKRKNTDKKPE